jgi:holliday junction DNA helicase RuvB
LFKRFFEWLAKPLEELRQEDRDYQKSISLISKEPETIQKLALEENENLYRPALLDSYIGQEKAKSIIKDVLSGTKLYDKTFPHTLIYGKAGCGKTTLARIIANELKKKFREVIGIDDPTWVCYFIQDLEGGVLFIDEIHKVKRNVCEELYPVMEDYKVDGEETPFTLIGATTEPAEIVETRKPFWDRFKIKIELEEYKEKEILKIIKQYQEKIFPNIEINYPILLKISKNSRLTPRLGISLLETTIYMAKNVEKALNANQIIYNSYTAKDYKVLELLSQYPKGIGVNAIASYLSIKKNEFEGMIEPFLFKNDLLMRTLKGRVITDKGIKLVKTLKRKLT